MGIAEGAGMVAARSLTEKPGTEKVRPAVQCVWPARPARNQARDERERRAPLPPLRKGSTRSRIRTERAAPQGSRRSQPRSAVSFESRGSVCGGGSERAIDPNLRRLVTPEVAVDVGCQLEHGPDGHALQLLDLGPAHVQA